MSIRRSESKSAGYIFVRAMVSLVLNIKRSKNVHRKIYPKDLNFACRELFNGGLGIVIARLVRWKNVFLSAYTAGLIQL